ncbi:exodeoxyribonuclease V subunit beta [Pseudoalteromonas sp. T1lg48]|uniref:exodeoxyribonuclease V subunit beta n=1 Tax=Pseudoalteromonas sp. T1lg48 TaxID=2077100 RepID=UPI000CF645A1|nr:exodeoxyribonuclease V subunit beta [Pseudoalteromonas sp. T1lg48]
MQILDPLSLPLVGQQLIEASAGTGKTYTITGLYLRYLLGMYQQTDGSQGEPLSVEQILVVTFTEAATSEIKDRVRARITEAKEVLLGKASSDELVQQLLAQVEQKQQAYNLLDAAAKSLDDSAIFTIHGFCQRMLKQHAFASNMAFNLHFVLDESELQQQAVFDFWRQFVYPLSAQQVQAVLAHYPSPYTLLKTLSPLINREQLVLEPAFDEPKQALAQVWQQQAQYLEALEPFKQQLRSGDFFSALAASDIKGNAKPKHKANVAGLHAFAHSDDLELALGKAKQSFELWSSASLQDPSIYKKNGSVFSHELVSEFERLSELSAGFGSSLAQLLCIYALDYVRSHVQTAKKRQQLLAPDDLLSGLYQALGNDSEGELARQIRSQYPVAMIDEFQDTDPVQYGIFNTLYRPLRSAMSGLTMIGDPKQAIYGFRGADIFTYIDAKRQLDKQRLYTLAVNHRSSTELVGCVNYLFSGHPQSFIYNDEIPFFKVKAKGKKEQLCLDGKPLAAMEFIWHGGGAEVLSKEQGQGALAESFAKRIHYLLAEAQQGRLTLGETSPCAGDFCILVRDRREAALMKTALAEAGVASVYLARESVFKQPLAQHLYRLLSVLHGPYDERLLRGMLSGPFYNFSAAQVHALGDDQQRWSELLNEFAELRRRWYADGALAMLEQLLWQNQLPQRWHELGWDVQRALTDFRHLGEILQHKQIELDGTTRLLSYFHQQLSSENGEGDSAQLRLETDAELVQIVTMHASKGLQYPIVFMPFAQSYRSAALAYYHSDGQLRLDLAQGEQAMIAAERERLAEDLRLLYVALTRAIYHCALGMYGIGQWGRSQMHSCALGYLLFSDSEPQADFYALLADKVGANPNMALMNTEQVFESTDVLAHSSEVVLEVATPPAGIERHWRATSFSALSYKRHEAPSFGAGGGDDDEDHRMEQYLYPASSAEEAVLSSYEFPKGPGPGSCLHDILEQISFAGVANGESQALAQLEQVCQQSLHKYALDERWLPLLQQWMADIVRCPLNDRGLSLGALADEHCLVEMEFHLPLVELEPTAFNHTMLSLFGYDFDFDFDRVKGVLKGFIDLIFCHEGRYYVLDYKSNYLGDSALDYDQNALTHAMNAHSYHVQGAIYMVALHRLLQKRLPDYDPEHHLGGMIYTFMRAMPEQQGVYCKAFSIDEIKQLDALFAQGERGD